MCDSPAALVDFVNGHEGEVRLALSVFFVLAVVLFGSVLVVLVISAFLVISSACVVSAS